MSKPSDLIACLPEHETAPQQDPQQLGLEGKRLTASPTLPLKPIECFLGLHPAIRPPSPSDETLSAFPLQFLLGYVPPKS